MSFLKPLTTPMEMSITATESAIAKIAMRIMGRERRLFPSFALTNRFAIKYSTFINTDG